MKLLQFYFREVQYSGQPIDEMNGTCGEFSGHAEASMHAGTLSQQLYNVVVMNEAGKKEYHYYDNKDKSLRCGNCKHFNSKSTTDREWGKCENDKNKVGVIGLNMIDAYMPDDQERKEIKEHFDDSIRYPDNFGCIFFEPIV